MILTRCIICFELCSISLRTLRTFKRSSVNRHNAVYRTECLSLVKHKLFNYCSTIFPDYFSFLTSSLQTLILSSEFKFYKFVVFFLPFFSVDDISVKSCFQCGILDKRVNYSFKQQRFFCWLQISSSRLSNIDFCKIFVTFFASSLTKNIFKS